jgi:hypothetical protein
MDSSHGSAYPNPDGANDTSCPARLGGNGESDVPRPESGRSTHLRGDRRACIFLIAETGSIKPMNRKTGRPSKGPRASLIFRMSTPLRGQTQYVLDGRGLTLNAFVEQLAVADVARPSLDRHALAPTDLASRRTGKRGRPSKGPRTTVVLRVSHPLADQIKERSAALGLSINDYLESLVSRDISAARATTGEEMVLDQSA